MNKALNSSLTLRKAKMISYSQLYEGENTSVDSFIKDIPTNEAVEWCSYIVFRKDNLKIGESDINIMLPLMFNFDSELQHKLTDFLGCSYNGVDCLINRYSFLRLIELLISHHNEEHHKLTKEEKTRLFKSYLLFCDEYLERINIGSTIQEKCTSEDMLKCYMPVTLLANDIDALSDPSLELIKGKRFFVDFVNSDKKFKKYVDDFIKVKGYDSAIEYLGFIFNIVTSTVVNDPPSNIIQFTEVSGKWINFMNSLSVDYDSFEVSQDFRALRSKPIYRLTDTRYVILFSKFFIDKLFQGMLFDMAATLVEIGTFDNNFISYKSIKQQVGERFSEKYILYRTLKSTLNRRMPVSICGEDLHVVLKYGEPDYYARRNNRILLFEFKDVRFDAQTKMSCNYETIRQKLYNCFVENEEARPKGVKQMVNVIVKKLPQILEITDKAVPKGSLNVYPILVYTDDSFDIEGINYYLNDEFKKNMIGVDDRFKVKDLVMVNLNLLMKLENLFVNGKIELDKVVNEYLAYKNSNEQLKSVPFNKYLFQYARRKGLDMKFTETFKATFNELLSREREILTV